MISAAIARTASKSPAEAIGKPGLDDIDPESREHPRHIELLTQIHARARRLLAIAEGRVEDPDPVGVEGRNGSLGRGAHGWALSW